MLTPGAFSSLWLPAVGAFRLLPLFVRASLRCLESFPSISSISYVGGSFVISAVSRSVLSAITRCDRCHPVIPGPGGWPMAQLLLSSADCF